MRSAITARIASDAPRLARRKASISSAIVLLHLCDEGLQTFDVVGRERPVLGVVGDERGDLAAEQAVQQALALAGDIVLAADEGLVAGPAADPLRGDRL